MQRRAWIVTVGCVLAATALAAPAPLKTIATGHGPTLLLIHGLGGTLEAWKPTGERLHGYKIVVAEIPGHGQEPMPDSFTVAAAGERVAATLATLGAESTIVVGQGMGGVFALRALAAHPGSARGLVLIDVSLIGTVQGADQQQRMLVFIDENYDSVVKNAFGHMGRDSAQSAEILAQFQSLPPPTLKAYLAGLMTLDANRDIRSVKVPILAIGTNRVWSADVDSTGFMKQMGYEGAAALSLARVTRTGFLVATDRPDTLAPLLDGFTRRVLGKGAPPPHTGAGRPRR
jgi:pimeloyl-ACP methyl ester carboxylesterase